MIFNKPGLGLNIPQYGKILAAKFNLLVQTSNFNGIKYASKIQRQKFCEENAAVWEDGGGG